MSYVDKFVLLAFNVTVMTMVATFIRWKCRAGNDKPKSNLLIHRWSKKAGSLVCSGTLCCAHSVEEVRPQVATHEMCG